MKIEAGKKEVEIEDPVCITLEYYRYRVTAIKANITRIDYQYPQTSRHIKEGSNGSPGSN